MGNDKKSVTVRLDEPELCEWLESQSSGVASVKTAIKICMYQYGKKDLLDAILADKFGGQTGNVFSGNQSKTNSSHSFTEEVESESFVPRETTYETPQVQVSAQQAAPQQRPQAPSDSGSNSRLASLL